MPSAPIRSVRRVLLDLRPGAVESPSWWVAAADADGLDRARTAMQNHPDRLIDAGFEIRVNSLDEAALIERDAATGRQAEIDTGAAEGREESAVRAAILAAGSMG